MALGDEDLITQMAKAGQAMETQLVSSLEDQPGFKTATVEDMAAKYLMMDYDQRLIMFREVFANHGGEGLQLIRSIMGRATEIYQGEV